MHQDGRFEFELAGLAGFKLKLEADAVVGVKRLIFTNNTGWFYFCNFLVLTHIFRALECVLVVFVQMSKSAPQTNQYRMSQDVEDGRITQPRSYFDAHPG